MTTESRKNSAIILPPVNFYGYVQRATIFSVLFNSRVRVRVMIRFSVWLFSGYARLDTLFSVAIVTLPLKLVDLTDFSGVIIIYWHLIQTRSQDCKFGGQLQFLGGQIYFEYYYTAIAC